MLQLKGFANAESFWVNNHLRHGVCELRLVSGVLGLQVRVGHRGETAADAAALEGPAGAGEVGAVVLLGPSVGVTVTQSSQVQSHALAQAAVQGRRLGDPVDLRKEGG